MFLLSTSSNSSNISNPIFIFLSLHLFFFKTILYLIICHRIFLVDRVVQSQRSDSSIKLTSIPLMNNQCLQIHISTAKLNSGNRARKKAIIMLLIIAIVYFLSFSPAQINFLHTQINQSHHLYEHRIFFLISILLALSSTAINPILFYIFSKFFRCKFNSYLQRLCPSCCSCRTEKKTQTKFVKVSPRLTPSVREK